MNDNLKIKLVIKGFMSLKNIWVKILNFIPAWTKSASFGSFSRSVNKLV